MFERLDNLLKRSQEIDELFVLPEIMSDSQQLSKLAKEQADLQPVVSAYQHLQRAHTDLSDAKALADVSASVVA